jgi:hypothetical protein
MPKTAPSQTAEKTTTRAQPESAMSATGVYVPAIRR